MDTRRARFRMDSTNANDMLVSCLELNCHNIRAQFPSAKKNAGAGASTSGCAKRTHPPTDEGDGDSEDEDGGFEGTEDTSIVEIDAPSPKTKPLHVFKDHRLSTTRCSVGCDGRVCKSSSIVVWAVFGLI
jgi:hypothetical protein